MVKHQSILAYKNARYLWLALLLSTVAIVAYLWHETPDHPNGGTWLGYTLGTISALMILILMFLGIRKRQYSSTLGMVQGWTSAHVYLGVSVLILSTLHGGFQLGWNVSTLTYVLLCLVVFSGLFGIYAYSKYPNHIVDNQMSLTREQLFAQVRDLDQQCIRIAENIDSETRALVQSAIDRTMVGGGVGAQLSGRDHSKVTLPSMFSTGKSSGTVSNANQNRLVEALSTRISNTKGGSEIAEFLALLSAISSKRALLATIRQDIRYKAILDIWLYFHVPFAVALLAALIAHVVSVFIYW